MDASRALVGITARSLAIAFEHVTLPQFRALALIEQAGSLRPGDLAEALAIQPSGVSRLTTRLRRAGLLQRRPAADNGREATLTLTPAGQAVLSEAMQCRRRDVVAALAGMSTSDRQAVTHGLRLLARAAGEHHRDALLLGW